MNPELVLQAVTQANLVKLTGVVKPIYPVKIEPCEPREMTSEEMFKFFQSQPEDNSFINMKDDSWLTSCLSDPQAYASRSTKRIKTEQIESSATPYSSESFHHHPPIYPSSNLKQDQLISQECVESEKK